MKSFCKIVSEDICKNLWCDFKSNLELILTVVYFTVSYHSFDKQCLSRVGFLLKCFNYPFLFFFPNNLFYINSSSKGADRGRKTADPSLRGISHLF